MHSFTLILLPPPFADVRARADALLEPHRLDEENDKPGWHTDYWTIGDGQIRDEATERDLGVAPDDYLHDNICFVRNLPATIAAAAVLTPDGQWHDLTDFGWKLMLEDAPPNRAAWERWLVHLRAILAAHTHCVALGYDVHS